MPLVAQMAYTSFLHSSLEGNKDYEINQSLFFPEGILLDAYETKLRKLPQTYGIIFSGLLVSDGIMWYPIHFKPWPVSSTRTTFLPVFVCLCSGILERDIGVLSEYVAEF